MPFDPDQYLAEKTGQVAPSFDPDKYLAEKTGQANPQSSSTPWYESASNAIKGAGQAMAPILRPLSQAMQPYAQSQMGSPQQLLNMVPDLARKGSDWLGQKATEEMGRSGINPQLSAGVGTAISMAPDIAMSAVNPTAGESGALQNAGGRSMNDLMGISPRTLLKLSGSGNPVSAGENLGQTFAKEGALGSNASETFNNVMRIKDQFGNQVGAVLNKLKQSGIPTEIPAEQALQPLVDQATKYASGALPETKRLAKPLQNIYSSLDDAAKSKGGMLGFDDLRDRMEEVGNLLQKTSPTSDRYGSYKDLYGILADARDNIVQKVASATQDPQMAKDLITANEGFSRYSRLMPDIKMAAAKEAVKGPVLRPVQMAENWGQRWLAGQSASSPQMGAKNILQPSGQVPQSFLRGYSDQGGQQP